MCRMFKYLTLVCLLFAAGVHVSYAQYDKDVFFMRGRRALADGKYAQAIENFNVLAQLDTADYWTFFFRGIAKYNLGDIRGARQDFDRTVRINPVFTSGYHYRGITESRYGNYDQALADLQKAIDLRPGEIGLYFSRGVTYFLSQQFDNAVKDFDKYIRKEPDDPSAFLNRGASYLFLGDTLKAFNDYNRAIKLDRFDPEGYVRRGRLYAEQKDYDNAIKYSSLLIDGAKDKFALSSASQMYTTMTDYLSYTNKEISYYEYMWRYNLSTESIWQVGFTTTSYGGALGSVFFNWDYQSYKPDYVPAQWVLDLYAANDLRYGVNFCQVTTGHSHGLTWPLLAKYWGNQDLFESAQLLHVSEPQVFRLAEQYLIRAEAYVQKASPDYSKASKDIAELRKARYSSNASASLMADNAMQIIEEERVKELYMEGFRLQDLKRWHKGFERKPQEQSLSNGSSIKVEPDDPRFVWPIPQHELESPDANILPNESNKK